MRRLAVSLVLLLACGSDRDKAPNPTPAAAAAPKQGLISSRDPEPATSLPPPLLWVVAAPNGASYLQGTMHLGIDVERHVHPIVLERVDASKWFVMETDISDIDPVEIAALAELPNGVTLDEKLTRTQWSKLTKLMPVVPSDAMKRLRPWFVLVAITENLLPATDPMDGVLHTRAKRGGLKLEYLEPWRYQIELLDEVIGTADIVDIVDNLDDTKQESIDLMEGYKAGDAALVEKMMYDPEKYEKNPKILDLLIVRRNREWIPKLEGYIETGNAFIAVGVGHLVGDRGVIAMLRKRGYKVERISLPQAQERPATPAAVAR